MSAPIDEMSIPGDRIERIIVVVRGAGGDKTRLIFDELDDMGASVRAEYQVGDYYSYLRHYELKITGLAKRMVVT